jgi:general secretion pathway protein D
MNYGIFKQQGQRPWAAMLIFLLAVGPTGCASSRPAASSAPAAPAPEVQELPARKVPVKVTTSPAPAKPEIKELARLKKEAKTEVDLDERGVEKFTAALQKVPTTRRKAPPKGEKVYPIDLNLKNADLVEAVRVLAETMGLNYSIDPKVKGTANVRASGKLTQSELLSILEAILAVNGATLVKSNGLYRIVPLDKAAAQALPVYSHGEAPPGMRAQVVFLEQTGAKEMVTVLKPLVSTGGNISEAANNAMILIDTPQNLDKLLNLIHLIDSQAMSQTMVRVVKVHNTDPLEIISEMETIFSAYGTLAQKGKFGVSFIPVTRLNSVMVLATSGALMERALYWVRQLDLKTDMLANVHIYNVENYKARNLADLLTQVYGGQPTGAKVKESKPEIGFGTQQASTIGGAGGLGGLGGTGGTRGAGGGLGGGLGGSTGGGLGSSLGGGLGGSGTGTGLQPTGGGGLGGLGETAAGAGHLKERATPGAAGGAGTSPKEGVRIIPDEENNLLVVVAPPHEWNIISRLLKSLDIMPRQVLNEVLIAEVNLTEDLKYGVEFLIGGLPSAQTSSSTTSGGTTTGGVLVAGTTTPGTIQGVNFATGAGAAFTAVNGFTFVATDTLNKIKGLINLLAAEGKVSILASPHIMAANNQEARIQIGEDVPIKTSESVPLISQTTSFQTSTVQYRSTGIILGLRPQINAKGLVTLEIAQEVSNALPLGVGETSPRISIRTAKTSLTTGDNQTIVLGGLIREDKTLSQAGIPGLRKLPGLGALFGSQGVSKVRTELLVLITPHIVTSPEEGARITREAKEKMGMEEVRPAPPAPGGSRQP